MIDDYMNGSSFMHVVPTDDGHMRYATQHTYIYFLLTHTNTYAIVLHVKT